MAIIELGITLKPNAWKNGNISTEMHCAQSTLLYVAASWVPMVSVKRVPRYTRANLNP